MPALPTDAALAPWKRQIQVALEIAEAVVEGAEKAREIQLAAAVDAHAALEATRKALETATSVAQLADMQSRLFTGNAGKAIAYWSSLASNVRDTQLRIASIVGGGAQGMLPPMELLREIQKAAEKAA